MVKRDAPRCRRFYVSGRVQGVYYRASACDIARQLGLTGWVRNMPDGRVEVVACGDSRKLDEFEAWLWNGPETARVDSVIAQEMELQVFDGFDVRGH